MATLRKLFLCFGRKQRTNTEEDIEIPKLTPAPAKNAPKAQIPTARARPRPAHVPDFRAAAERQQSEQSPSQSQSDATEPATKPQSMGSSTKPESDSDDKGPVKASSQSPDSSARADADPDEITPVEPNTKNLPNVVDALEDRRKLLERLRCRNEVDEPAPGINPKPEQRPPEQSEREGG